MTKEEAIDQLTRAKKVFEDSTKREPHPTIKALDMAIEVLSKKPCEDCISRQAVLYKIKEVCYSKERERIEFRVDYGACGAINYIIKFIESLPNVKPKGDSI